MDVVTPLKISILSNIINVLLDPVFIFTLKWGVGGAAAATCIAELISCGLYLRELLNKSMLNIAKMFKPPSMEALKPILLGNE